MNAIGWLFLSSIYYRILFFTPLAFLFSPTLSDLKKNNACEHAPRLTITYTGNMGIFVSSSEASILIDGLHEYYGPGYLNPPGSEISKILHQGTPYTGLANVLFTHYHRDHYSAHLSKGFLQSSEKNRVIGAPQVIDSLPVSQTVNAWNKNALLFTDTAQRLSVFGFDIPHTWPQRHSKVQNVAYLIDLDQLTILHIGDADTDTSAFSRLKLGRVDAMIVPIWFLMNKEGIRIIREIIKPGRVIATHISPVDSRGIEKYRLPGIETHFFTVMKQAVIISG